MINLHKIWHDDPNASLKLKKLFSKDKMVDRRYATEKQFCTIMRYRDFRFLRWRLSTIVDFEIIEMFNSGAL